MAVSIAHVSYLNLTTKGGQLVDGDEKTQATISGRRVKKLRQNIYKGTCPYF